MTNPLLHIATWRGKPGASGIPSVCSAHPLVIEAAMRAVRPTGLPLLIEATCNQVNQEGGYTGMTPADFQSFVKGIAAAQDFPIERLMLGGDHLGPNPWKALPADEAMERAEVMIRAYAAAGFTKLHLDCSMGCKGESAALDDEVTAERAARLVAAAEAARPGGFVPDPVYVIGTEVPIPGGAMEELGELEITDPEAARRTIAIHQDAFDQVGQSAAFGRVIAVVVQPGVEFGNHNVIDYNSGKASDLSAILKDFPALVFEAHSTDYQRRGNLSKLIGDGFAILKVGPGLTFALREALYGLDAIAEELHLGVRTRTLRASAEEVMLAKPENWHRYYDGDETERALQRHFSYSDRIRYYWPDPEVQAALDELMVLLGDVAIPETLIGQYLGARYADVRNGRLAPLARPLVLASVEAVMQDYIIACGA